MCISEDDFKTSSVESGCLKTGYLPCNLGVPTKMLFSAPSNNSASLLF